MAKQLFGNEAVFFNVFRNGLIDCQVFAPKVWIGSDHLARSLVGLHDCCVIPASEFPTDLRKAEIGPVSDDFDRSKPR
ncbi:MAG: hypothetical protein AAGG45_10320 [Pseudomonadota bacterium]